MLFPVRLDDAVFATKEAWAGKLRDNRHIVIRAWKDHDAYQRTLERLLRDLRVTGRPSCGRTSAGRTSASRLLRPRPPLHCPSQCRLGTPRSPPGSGFIGWGQVRRSVVLIERQVWSLTDCETPHGSLLKLGCVDGFNQDQPACKTDDGGVADVGLFAAHGDALEPLELADCLFDTRPEFIETLGKEAASLLGVFTTGDHRTDATRKRGDAICLAVISFIGHRDARADVWAYVE